MPETSVLILALNEEQNLSSLLPEIRTELEQCGLEWEIVVVDGGSEDRTVEIARSHGAHVIAQTRRGYAEGLREGLYAVRGTYLITLDGDLSHPAALLPAFIAARFDADIVVGSRWMAGGGFKGPFYRGVLSRILNLSFKRLLSLPVRDISSGYRLYSSRILSPDRYRSKDFSILQEILISAHCDGFKVKEIPFVFRNRFSGTSHVRLGAFALSYLRTLVRMWLLRNDSAACDHDSRAYQSPFLPQRWWQRRRHHLLCELLGSFYRGGRVLDLGSGSSKTTQTLPHVIACDYSLPKLRFLQSSNPLRIAADATNLPFADASFDCVIASQLFDSIETLEDVIGEIQRILRPGGVLIISVMNSYSHLWPIIHRLYRCCLPHAYGSLPSPRHDFATLTSNLDKAGFTIKERRLILGSELIFRCIRG